MGELHLDVSLKRVTTDFNVEIRQGEPRVAYRETLKSACTEHVVFERMMGDTPIYAEVTCDFAPISAGEAAFDIKNAVKTPNVPKAFIAAAERALQDGLRTGGLSGYPLIYVAATLVDLKFSADNTTEGAVAGAVLECIDKMLPKAGTVILEPLMHLEILTPEDTVGEISMYLQPRRAIISDIETLGSIMLSKPNTRNPAISGGVMSMRRMNTATVNLSSPTGSPSKVNPGPSNCRFTRPSARPV